MNNDAPQTATKAPDKVEDFTCQGLSARLYLPPGGKGWQLGYIGNLKADKDATEVDRTALLVAAKKRLFELGAQKVIGPIDGDTWHRYRLPLSDPSNLTFVEPSYPGFTAADFYSADMPIMATYHSSIINDLPQAVRRAGEISTEQLSGDVHIRHLNLSDYDNEMALLYAFSTSAFCKNFLYSDISPSDFNALYQPLKSLIREELVLIAQSERSREVLAVMLALPDPVNKSLVIAKTIARSVTAPRATGRFLFHTLLERCLHLGYSSVLCALIKDSNISAALPAQLGGKQLNRFALFGSTKQ
ncbi:MAG: hypothetical protein JST01_16400 [Cyanobacteria bacterium SZAS TMP-1]|nr:hypothetical protein [Cyanobacteria bacterium SZAS TMP-1]